MAQSNKRYFNTFFFEDPYVEDLDSDTRFLYMTMILNPHNNLAGCYEISIKKLKAYTGLPEDRIRSGIQKLQQDRKILFSGTWLSLKNFIKNNELNPNMCKNSFDIMRAAPKDSIIFIVSDRDGNGEPWLEEFVEKVGRGINSSIDSKNRNAISKARKDSLPSPEVIQNIEFNMNSFLSGILNRQTALPMGTVGGTLPPTIPKALGEPSGEYKGEKEYKKEVEEEEETVSIPPPSQKFVSYSPQSTIKPTTLDQTINHWNSKSDLPKTRLLTINLGERARPLNDVLLRYTSDEVLKAVDNYHTIQSTPGTYDTFTKYQDVFGFIKSGLEKFCDDSQPLKNFILQSAGPTSSEFGDESQEERGVREYQEYKDRQAKEGTQ